jgi:hypothetical protein
MGRNARKTAPDFRRIGLFAATKNAAVRHAAEKVNSARHRSAFHDFSGLARLLPSSDMVNSQSV